MNLLICFFYINIFFVLNFSTIRASEFSSDPLSYFRFKNKVLQDRVNIKSMALPQSTDIIMAYDFTSSNAQTGIKSFNGKNLHHLFSKEDVRHNPYQTVTKLLIGNLVPDEQDREFKVLGFGDERSIGDINGVSLVSSAKKPAIGLYGVLKAYRSYRKSCYMSGPTSFSGPIRIASQQAIKNRRHTLLIILTDGALSSGIAQRETIESLASASKTPLSILIIGVGDGTERERTGLFPGLQRFKEIKALQDSHDAFRLRIKNNLKFDNVNFINANDYIGGVFAEQEPKERLEKFLKSCVKKIDIQKEYMKQNGLI
ncbi:MAG: hypothetical protein AB8G05_07745 [Oligoflexales bacterium]